MGFISSILCCSSDSSQANSKWDNRQVNSRSQQKQGQKKSSDKTELYSTTGMGTTSTNLGYNATSESNHKKSPLPRQEASPAQPPDRNSKQTFSDNLAGDEKLQKTETLLRERDGGIKGSSLNSTPRSSEKLGREAISNIGSENEAKENEKVEKLRSQDYDGGAGEVEKQGIYVYTGDTDTSTGGSSSDHHSHLPQSTVTTNTTNNSNQLPRSPDLPETAATVQEGEDVSGSGADTDVALYPNNSHQEETDPDMGIDAGPPYDDEGIDEEYVDLTELQLGQYHAPGFNTLLSPRPKYLSGKKCLVLDLDETLVHSSFKYLKGADFVLPVDIDDQIHNVYVMKRPGVDEFLKKVGSLFEVVVFTASVARYGDPLLDILDKYNSVHHRLFREACYNYEGNYIKNLSQIGRPLSEIIILDNSPASYIFHPQHAIPISSWFSDTHDNELLDIIPLLEDLSEQFVPDVGKVLDITI